MFSDYATAVDTRQERTLSMMDDERDNFISETLIPENLEQFFGDESYSLRKTSHRHASCNGHLLIFVVCKVSVIFICLYNSRVMFLYYCFLYDAKPEFIYEML